jgi:ankyrin repeat protein
VMELLLKHGKRKQSDLQMVQAVTTDGRTPLAIYCSNKNNANFNSNSDTIDKNAEAINRVLTLLLSDYGSSVDLSDTNGLTPLMHAALIAEAPLVRLLLQRFGADAARTSDQEGCTAEAFASRRGYVDIVHILNEHSSNDRR